MNGFSSTSATNSAPKPRRTNSVRALLILTTLAVFPFIAGCDCEKPEGALVLTQTPKDSPATASPQDILDERYPPGSRVVLALPPFRPADVRVLSAGLVAAGGPVVAPNGQAIYFVGKPRAGDAWQIYQTGPGGGRPAAVTALAGGAMDPAILANGDLVFSSPVPPAGATWKGANAPALYAQALAGQPRRLTFGSAAAVEPTVLGDGRILFVSARASPNPGAAPGLGLFTINNDGTEVTAFALDHDGAPEVHRPRELRNGRIGFLATGSAGRTGEVWAEAVRTARPFASRTKLFNLPAGRCASVEPAGDGNLLASFENRAAMAGSSSGSFAIYRVGANTPTLGQPLFDDPAWHDLEAAHVASRANPIGHISAMIPGKQTGTILCLNADFSRERGTNGAPAVKAARVRVLAGNGQGPPHALGEVPLRADGSFLAEVPADTPIGFESLDADGQVLQQLAPSIWVRPGENRSCLGCHEPYNRSPRNLRPIAAFFPPVPLTDKLQALAQQAPAHEKR